MKNLNVLFLILLMGLLTFTSCENEDVILDDQVQDVTVESESITAALNAMTTNFDDSGNVDQSSNPAGNIIFDFCFDFVYPITLSYNTGATVSVNDLDGLINVIINSTDQLFINGIAFPFDVETYDDASGSIIIQTINNEAEFINLLDDCDFDDIDSCNCFEDYDPVCVSITDPNGNVFTVTYPNECYANCDGFDDDDFVDDCDDDDYYDDDFLCFEFIYPLDIILDDGSVVTITDDDDFENTMYNNYYFEFVYPFSVELEDDDDDNGDDDDSDTIVVINNEQEFQDLLDDCYDFPDGSGCEQCESEPINPVCVQYTDPSGNVVIEVFPNLCFAQCVGFTAADVVDCPDDDDDDDCDDDEILEELIECNSYTGFHVPSGDDITFVFNLNSSTVDIFGSDGALLEIYGFSIEEGTATTPPFITIIASFDDPWSSDWIYNCNDDGPDFFTADQSIVNIDDDCD